jgi:ElaB/YqjD/DUF883 family membrane-anchored ribosome-binding protein
MPSAGNHSPLAESSDITNTAQTLIADIATKATDKAQAVAQSAADRVDQHRGDAARILANAASTVHDGVTRLPAGEGVTRFAAAAAEEIDGTARYVREHTTHQMLADLKEVVRRHPAASVVGAVVVGVLVGRGLRKH